MNTEIENFNSLVPKDKPDTKITTKEQKIDYLKNEMVRRALLYQEALKRGLDKNEDIRKSLEKTKMDLLVIGLIKQEAEQVEATYQEIKDFYEAYKDQLKEPEERHIREIVVPTEAEARDVLIQLLQGVDFASIARERSKSASSKNGGDLGFIKKGDSPHLDAEAFSQTLEVGKFSNIFKGPNGYYIIKLEAKKGGKEKSLTDMWDDIKSELTFLKQQKKIEGLIDELSRNAKMEFYEEKIE